MLLLTRKLGQEIRIGKDIVITVVRIGRDKVGIGIDAPTTDLIMRGELLDPKRQQPPDA
jgi:carbon storage regulator CsrA